MSKYDDDIFGDDCYDNFEEYDIIKDNGVNKIKTKGVGKTKINSKAEHTDPKVTQDSETIVVKLTKEELFGAQILEKKRKREEAIAKSKAEVAARQEKESAEKIEKEAASIKAAADAIKDEEDWDTKFD